MNDEIKEIREYISCPQFGDDHYGKWGALRLEQRIKIKSLLDYITNLQQEIEKTNKLLSIANDEVVSYTNACIDLQQEIKEANDSITWWTNRFKAVERDNKELKQKIEQYENPDDMTLFYMWLDTKAKDKIKELQQENETRQQDINNLTYQLAKMKEENERLKEEKQRLLYNLEKVCEEDNG